MSRIADQLPHPEDLHLLPGESDKWMESEVGRRTRRLKTETFIAVGTTKKICRVGKRDDAGARAGCIGEEG